MGTAIVGRSPKPSGGTSGTLDLWYLPISGRLSMEMKDGAPAYPRACTLHGPPKLPQPHTPWNHRRPKKKQARLSCALVPPVDPACFALELTHFCGTPTIHPPPGSGGLCTLQGEQLKGRTGGGRAAHGSCRRLPAELKHSPQSLEPATDRREHSRHQSCFCCAGTGGEEPQSSFQCAIKSSQW